MAFGLVIGHQPGRQFVSMEWDPAQVSPSVALNNFMVTFPEAESYTVVETQCDGTIRPVWSGLIADGVYWEEDPVEALIQQKDEGSPSQ